MYKDVKQLRQSDIISRLFTKDRGSTVVEYEFTTFHNMFDDHLYENENIRKLIRFMQNVFHNGYPVKEYGCSNCNELVVDWCEDHTDILTYKCGLVGYIGEKSRMHEIVQKHFMKNCDDTICMELPVWNHDRQGFIDLIRINNGKIQIADFKPHAYKERPQKVMSQLFYYKKMLCDLCDIPYKEVEACYFDKYNCYYLKH